MSSRERLVRLFPGLRNTSFQITSPQDPSYNCVAWATRDDQALWWPSAFAYWPRRVRRQETVAAFVEMFRSLGYSRCIADSLEPNFEKVAIFADRDGVPTHVARQLPGGNWTSKIGRLEDITHESLRALTGAEYGKVAAILKKSALNLPDTGSV